MGTLLKITLEISSELLIEAKKYAAEHRTTLRALLETGLRRELSGFVQARKAKRSRIRWVTAPGGLPKGMDIVDRTKMLQRFNK